MTNRQTATAFGVSDLLGDRTASASSRAIVGASRTGAVVMRDLRSDVLCTARAVQDRLGANLLNITMRSRHGKARLFVERTHYRRAVLYHPGVFSRRAQFTAARG